MGPARPTGLGVLGNQQVRLIDNPDDEHGTRGQAIRSAVKPSAVDASPTIAPGAHKHRLGNPARGRGQRHLEQRFRRPDRGVG